MSIKNKISAALWLVITCLPLSLYYSSFYLAGMEDSSRAVIACFYLAYVSVLICAPALAAMLLIVPLWGLRARLGAVRITLAALVVSLLFIWLSIDAHVYAFYRFHMNLAMYDLLVNGGGQIIAFSDDMIRGIAVEVAIILAYSLLAVLLALWCGGRFRVRRLIALGVIGLVVANGVNVYAAAVGNQPLAELSSRVPLYYPVTMNHQLKQWGLISEEMLAQRRISTSAQGSFNYPRQPLKYEAQQTGKPRNVLILAVDSLRYDMLSEQVMPKTYAFSQDCYVFSRYFSAGNATRSGVFSLFYGIPPSYWQAALNTGIRPALIDAALSQDYRLGTFASATLYKPEFNQTVFAGLDGLRLESPGSTAVERDESCVRDFTTFLRQRDGRPFFAFIFLDNVHAYEAPESACIFNPYNSDMNYMELDNSTDPVPYLNHYRNAVHYADENVGLILDELRMQGLLNDTIVIITADHGQEFNDNGMNFWGHNGNYTKYQIQVPLVVWWPGRGKGAVSELAVSYDVSVTLLQDLFGVTNAPEDYSVGQNLFNLRHRDFFVAGSYNESAVVEEDRIVMIDHFGIMHFKDSRWKDSENRSRNQNLISGVMQMQEFIGKPRNPAGKNSEVSQNSQDQD